jgi:hypothetical protein
MAFGIGRKIKEIARKKDPKPRAERIDKRLEEKIGMGPAQAAKSNLELYGLPFEKQTYKTTEAGVRGAGRGLDQNKFAILGAYTGGYKGALAGAGYDKKGVLTWFDEEDEETIAPPIALPDEELMKTSRRRARARRKGGRSSSILTGGVLG